LEWGLTRAVKHFIVHLFMGFTISLDEIMTTSCTQMT
jgi:hypothetical protein